jgi:hypothetical protein
MQPMAIMSFAATRFLAARAHDTITNEPAAAAVVPFKNSRRETDFFRLIARSPSFF